MPRRHALRTNYLADHRRKPFDHVVARHLPGTDAAVAMAGDAVVDQHRRNRLFIGDLGVRRTTRRLRHPDLATAHCRAGGGCRSTGQHRIERRRGVLRVTAIGERPVPRVDDQHFAVVAQPERLADQLCFVDQDGQIDALFLCGRSNLIAMLGQVGVDHQERDALRSILVAQVPDVGKRPGVGDAAVALRDQHDRLHVGQIGELVRLACVIQQAEVVDSVAGCDGRTRVGRAASNDRSHRYGQNQSLTKNAAHEFPPEKVDQVDPRQCTASPFFGRTETSQGFVN